MCALIMLAFPLPSFSLIKGIAIVIMNGLRRLYRITLATSLLVAPVLSFADNRSTGEVEFSFFAPYYFSEDVDFDGGASAELEDTLGFGFGIAYNINTYLASRFDFEWSSRNYDATRVADDDDNTRSDIRSRLDDVRLNLGLDYYFLGEGTISPYITGNLGWQSLDTNIPAGPPNTICWWDPWWGYICDGYQPTYTDSNWYYGAGIGVRVPLGRSNFFRIGYYESRSSVSNTKSDPTFAQTRIEFGWAY